MPFGVATAALTWAVGLTALAAWRGEGRRLAPRLVTAVELGALYYLGPTEWGWAVPLPDRSPVFTALAADPGGRAGRGRGRQPARQRGDGDRRRPTSG